MSTCTVSNMGLINGQPLQHWVRAEWPKHLGDFETAWADQKRKRGSLFNELVSVVGKALRLRDPATWCDTDENDAGVPIEVMVLNGGRVTSIPVTITNKSLQIAQTKVPLGALHAGTMITSALARAIEDTIGASA